MICNMKDIKSVCVFCASSPNTNRVYLDAAFRLGQLLADRGIRVITGGGSMGLMARVEDGVLDHGGHATAVIPKFMIEAGWLHQGLDDVISTETMQERKDIMFRSSDAIITLPGGCGTLDELTEVLTMKQLGLLSCPVVILNTNDYFSLFLRHLQKQADEGFMMQVFTQMWSVACSPEEAVARLYEIPEWDTSVGKLPSRHD